jgi:hypothetical protein
MPGYLRTPEEIARIEAILKPSPVHVHRSLAQVHRELGVRPVVLAPILGVGRAVAGHFAGRFRLGRPVPLDGIDNVHQRYP